MNARVTAALLAGGVLLALLVFMRAPGTERVTAATERAVEPVQPDAAVEPGVETSRARRPSPSASLPDRGIATAPASGPAPLPAPNTRVADVYDDLARRARAGDTRASCRLAAELARCSQLPLLRLQLKHTESRALQEPTDPARTGPQLDRVARMGNTVETLEAVCEGTSPERVNEAFDWLLRAAAGGHVASMSRFAREPMLSPQRFLHELDRLATYRESAVGFAMNALEAGDAEILPVLANAWGPKEASWELLAQLLPTDRVRSRAAGRLYQMVRNLPQPKPGDRAPDPFDVSTLALSPEEEAQADALAAEWFARWHGGQTKPARPYLPPERDDFSWCENER